MLRTVSNVSTPEALGDQLLDAQREDLLARVSKQPLALAVRHYDAALGSPLTRDGALSAFHEAFLVAVGLAVLGIIAALLIDDKAAAGTMRRVPLPPDGEETVGVPAG